MKQLLFTVSALAHGASRDALGTWHLLVEDGGGGGLRKLVFDFRSCSCVARNADTTWTRARTRNLLILITEYL